MKYSLILLFSFYCNFVFGTQKNLSKDWVENIENYFNTQLNFFESDFLQEDSKGNLSSGKMFLKRKKGLMKLKYNDPNPNVIIVKDKKLTHFNRELKEKTQVSIYSSPLFFLLDKKLDLKKNLKILSLKENKNAVAVTFCKNDDTEGAIKIIFSKNPFQIQCWVIENKNSEFSRCTKIFLENPKFSASYSEKEFETFS